MTDPAAQSIILWGLTGAGKTSLGTALAARLGLGMVSGYAIRRQLLGLPKGDPAVERADWLFGSAAEEADDARLRGSTAEDHLDTILLQRFLAGPPAIFDAWFLPWTAPVKTFSICLDVAVSVRTNRIAAASKSAGTIADIREAIHRKDHRSAAYGSLRFGVDILTNRDPFTAIIGIENDEPFADVLTLLAKLSRLHFGWGSSDQAGRENTVTRIDLLQRVPSDLRRELERE